MKEGCSLGAFSLLKHSTQPWGIYSGVPAKKVKNRSKDMLKLEEQYLKSLKS